MLWYRTRWFTEGYTGEVRVRGGLATTVRYAPGSVDARTEGSLEFHIIQRETSTLEWTFTYSNARRASQRSESAPE